MMFDQQVDGPATHALIIGVGAYPALSAERAEDGWSRAYHFATCLKDVFRNSRPPLGSIEFVSSRRMEPSEAADHETALAAAQRWWERANSDPGNMTIFYFSGLGLAGPRDILLALDDFDERSGAGLIDSGDLIAAMSTCRATRQAYFIDARREPLPSRLWHERPPRLLERQLEAPRPVDRAVYRWAGPDSGGVSSRYLTDALDLELRNAASDRSPLDTEQLHTRLAERIKEFHRANGTPFDQGIAVELKGSFIFFDPKPAGEETIDQAAGDEIQEAANGAVEDDGPEIGHEDGDGTEPPPQESSASAQAPAPVQTYTEFVTDEAESERDALDRGVLAISLARQLHRIWRKTNRIDHLGGARVDDSRAAFVLHLDAPWGGGKTSFAHFVGRVLNPYADESRRPPHFLTERYGKTFNLAQLFLEKNWPPHSRRPWITVWFNAWQAEDSRPPWWFFYQTIRKQCFDAIRTEGDEPLNPAGTVPKLLPPDWEREERWRSLMLSEYRWRLGDRKVVTPLVATLFSLLIAAALWAVGAVAPGDDGISFALDNGFGFVLAVVTGVSAIWAVGTFATESIIPGTDSLAERLSLGSGDPFHRFRLHFARTMERVRRPVIVIVDDLDRCKPDFIVDLMRGIQTLLRSPRVVFVILGDRDWIERAFETHHQSMSKVNVGPEQSLGARFVEKAIQMSFVLPNMKAKQQAYVQRVLRGLVEEEEEATANKVEPEVAVQVRNAVKEVAARSSEAVLDPQGLSERVREKVEKSGGGTAAAAVQLDRLIGEEVAIHVSADAGAEREIVHLLEQLAPYFPSNPRQIKRIINAMTTYTSAAMGMMRDQVSPDFLTQLAVWITLMSEWPETWRLLASCPDLADIIGSGKQARARLAKLPAAALPGSVAATLTEIERIRNDPSLMGLITASGREGPRLDSAAVRLLGDLTPLYRGRRRLAEPDANSVRIRRRTRMAKKPAQTLKAPPTKRPPNP